MQVSAGMYDTSYLAPADGGASSSSLFLCSAPESCRRRRRRRCRRQRRRRRQDSGPEQEQRQYMQAETYTVSTGPTPTIALRPAQCAPSTRAPASTAAARLIHPRGRRRRGGGLPPRARGGAWSQAPLNRKDAAAITASAKTASSAAARTIIDSAATTSSASLAVPQRAPAPGCSRAGLPRGGRRASYARISDEGRYQPRARTWIRLINFLEQFR